MLLRLTGAQFEADGLSTGDLIALAGVLVAMAAIGVAIWAVLYRVTMKAYHDDTGIICVVCQNRGRVTASVGPARLVVRSRWLERIVPLRKDRVVILKEGYPAEKVELTPNAEATLYLPPKATLRTKTFKLPERPFGKPVARVLRPGEAIIQVKRGARRVRYLRRVRAQIGLYQAVPSEYRQRLPDGQQPPQPPAAAPAMDGQQPPQPPAAAPAKDGQQPAGQMPAVPPVGDQPPSPAN